MVSTDDPQFDDVLGVWIEGSGSGRHRFNGTKFMLSDEFHPAVPGTAGTRQSTGIRIGGNDTGSSMASCYFDDFGAPSGMARGIHIVSGIKSFVAKPIYMWGFHDPGDVFLDIEDPTIEGLDIEVHGNSMDSDNFPHYLDHENISQYVRITGGWNDSNQIVFVNDATRQRLVLKTGKAY
jgi:hypothetical protein